MTSRLVARVKSACRTDRSEQIANTACVIAMYNWEGGNTAGKGIAKHRFPGICKLVAGGGWTSDVTHTSCCGRSVFESRMKDRLPNSAAPAGSLPLPIATHRTNHKFNCVTPRPFECTGMRRITTLRSTTDRI